jgi:cell division protein FtsB
LPKNKSKNQKQELEEKEQQIQNQKQELETKEQSIKNLNDELISIYMSKSWKITRPLRSLIRKIKKGK